MEIFRCACGKGFDLEVRGKARDIGCPNCNARWRIEPAGGRYRIYEWVD